MLTAISKTNGDKAMNANKLMLGTILVLTLVPVSAWAKPIIEVNTSVETEVTVEQDGRKIVKRVPAKTTEPGNTLIYTVQVNNKGDEKATSVVINNPVPAGTYYVGDSATGKGSKILFSVDGGKHFDKPGRLMHERKLPSGKIKKTKAKPEHYTHIRWVIDEVPAGKSGTLGFRIKVK